MAELSSDLQASIDALGAQHTNLVQAVRDYTGGSVASTTNDLLAYVAEVTATIKSTERNLLGLVDRSNGGKLPSMLLDFASQTYFTGLRGLEQAVDPHKYLNVSRATSKWVMGPQGKLVEVPPNTLAYEYDPVTGESKGVLIEESRTNLMLWPEDLTSAAWHKYGENLWEFSESTKPSPIDGVNFSRFFVPQDVVSRTSLYDQSKDTVIDSDYVFSFIVSKDYNLLRYCQIDGMSGSRSIFDIDTGTFEYVQSTHTVGTTDLGDSWRVWVSFAAADVTARVGVMPQESNNIGYNRDFTVGGYQYTTGFQFEEGSIPSSYIPTTDSPATRNADNVSRVLGDEYNPREGVIFTELELRKQPGSNPNPWSASNNSSIRVEFGGNSLGLTLDLRGSGQGFNSTGLNGVEGGNKLAVSYRDGEVIVALNGSSETLQVEGSMGAFIEGLNLGKRSSGNYLNASIGMVTQTPYALTETELQELTANG